MKIRKKEQSCIYRFMKNKKKSKKLTLENTLCLPKLKLFLFLYILHLGLIWLDISTGWPLPTSWKENSGEHIMFSIHGTSWKTFHYFYILRAVHSPPLCSHSAHRSHMLISTTKLGLKSETVSKLVLCSTIKCSNRYLVVTQ